MIRIDGTVCDVKIEKCSDSQGATMTLTTEDSSTLSFTVEGDWVQDIRDMHAKFSVREIVAQLPKEQLHKYLKFRLEMMQEEVTEAFDAFEAGDADGVVDALIDNCVFTIGTLDAFNIDSYEAWARVHEKNMMKEPGVKPERPNPYGFPDMIKPEGWTAPTHEDNVGLIRKALSKE